MFNHIDLGMMGNGGKMDEETGSKIAKALGAKMYSIEELAAERLELINEINALRSLLAEAEKILAPSENWYISQPNLYKNISEALAKIREARK